MVETAVNIIDPGSPAPRASIRVLYELVDITRDITPYVKGLSYTDCIAEADDLQIDLADPEGLWSGPWMPDKNAKLTVSIHAEAGGQKSSLPCGIFYIDTVGENGPPASVSIKATSADLSTTLRRELKVRAWENVTLRTIFADLATGGGLTLLYLADANPSYSRIEQKKQSDLEFAKSLCERENLRIKVTGGQLVIFDPDEYDSASSVETYPKHDKTRVIGYNTESQVTEAYRACVVKYRHPGQKKLLEYTYQPDDGPEAGATLRINERCDSIAQAQRLARARMAQANINISTADITLMGDTRLVAGVNITLDPTWGAYAGKYAVTEATHSLWPYKTDLKLRRISA